LPGIDPKTARVTWTAGLMLVLFGAIYAIRETLVVFAVALLFACLLFPLVDRIGRRFSPKNRTPALAFTYLLVIGIMTAAGIAIGSRVVAEAKQLIAQPPDVRGYFSRLRLAYPVMAPAIEAAEGKIRQQFGEIASAVPRFGLRVLAASTNLADLIVIPVVSFFVLKDGAGIRDGLLALLPAGASRTRAKRTIDDISELMLHYTRAVFLLCSTVLVVYSAVLSAMGVQYALLLSAIAFFCEFSPVVGPVTALAVILAVSALSGYPHLLWVAIFLGIFRLLQDYVISPRLMSHGVELHPIWVIFGVFAGAEIGGVAGVFLSVPVMALVRLLVVRLMREKVPVPGKT
jgi:predicted PurR-regulated permease PerM